MHKKTHRDRRPPWWGWVNDILRPVIGTMTGRISRRIQALFRLLTSPHDSRSRAIAIVGLLLLLPIATSVNYFLSPADPACVVEPRRKKAVP